MSPRAHPGERTASRDVDNASPLASLPPPLRQGWGQESECNTPHSDAGSETTHRPAAGPNDQDVRAVPWWESLPPLDEAALLSGSSNRRTAFGRRRVQTPRLRPPSCVTADASARRALRTHGCCV